MLVITITHQWDRAGVVNIFLTGRDNNCMAFVSRVSLNYKNIK